MSFPIQLAASTDSPRLASAEEGLDGRSGHSPSGRAVLAQSRHALRTPAAPLQ